MTVRILLGDCREKLRELEPESVNCVVTSPPYWGLRDYKTAPLIWGGAEICEHEWGIEGKRHRGGPPGESEGNAGRDRSAIAETADVITGAFCRYCNAWRGSLGLEPTPDLYVEHLVEIFREVRRVLRPDGTVWLNLGDSYATGAGAVGEHPGGGAQGEKWGANVGPMTQPNRLPIPGLKPKDLVGAPWMVAFALRADGWWLRQDIIWHKPNPMPESVTDRCTKSHEYIFLLSKSEHYYFDSEAIAEPVSEGTVKRYFDQIERIDEQAGSDRVPGKTNGPMKAVVKKSGNKARVPASERGVPGAPLEGGSAGAVASGVPWEGSTRNKRSVWPIDEDEFVQFLQWKQERALEGGKSDVWSVVTMPFKEAHFATFPPALIEPCILAGCPIGGVVLDICGGAGTTGLVADRLQRDAVLIELNPSYIEMQERRIVGDAPLFAEVTR